MTWLFDTTCAARSQSVEAWTRGTRAVLRWRVTRDKLKALLQEYGRVALWTYFVIFALVLAGFAIAISAGFQPSSATGGAGLLLSAWLATKLTQPFRIAGTLVATPVIAALLKKWRKPPTAKAVGSAEPS